MKAHTCPVIQDILLMWETTWMIRSGKKLI